MEEIKEAGAKVATAFRGFFAQAKEKVAERIYIDDYKGKL